MELMKIALSVWRTATLCLAVAFWNGCASDGQGTGAGGKTNPPAMGVPATNNPSADLLAVGDKITVSFTDLVNAIQPVECAIKEDGSISLILNQTFAAAGKTSGQLERDIRERYVPKYFVNMTPIVKSQERFFLVGGEVRLVNRYLYLSKMTVLGAIAAAGGFGDYADRTDVVVTRVGGKQYHVNCKRALKDPKLDIEIFPGDMVNVHRRIM